jgi:hypothetical protein
MPSVSVRMNNLMKGDCLGILRRWFGRFGALSLMMAMVLILHHEGVAQSGTLLSTPAVNFTTVNLAELPNLAEVFSSRRAASPNPATNFQALLDNNTFSPPSIAAAAGTNALMVALNTELSVQDRSGVPLFTTTLSNFWGSQIGVNGRVFGSKMAYDPSADRWIFTACANPQSPASSLLLAVSATSDPVGTWFQYSIPIDSTNNLTWGDVGGLGFNDDWIVVTKNLRATGGNTFSRSRIYVFNKAALMQSLPVGNIQSTNVLLTVIQDFTVSSLVPAVCYDSSPSLMYLMANGQGDDGNGNGTVRLFRMTAVTNIFSLNETIPSPVGGAPWSDLPNVGNVDFLPQRDSARLIAAGDSRISNLILRGGSLWCAQTVFLPAGNATRSAVQWWELNPSGTVVQFGRVDDAANVRYYAYPSIAVNRNRDALLGYSSFSLQNYPSASYSFRFGTDPLNLIQKEVVYKDGEAPYFKVDSNTGLNSWGDYSATVVDAESDLDMWTVQEYSSLPVSGVDRWGTWWAKVLLSAPADGNLEVVVDPPNGSLIPAGQAQVFEAKVFDTQAVTNAVVRVDAPGVFTNITFLNNGGAPDTLANDNVYTRAINLPSTNTVLTNIFTVSATNKNTLIFTNFYTVAPPPANDLFARAFKIPDRLPETNGVVIGGNFFASVEVGEPSHAGVAQMGNSVWWNWAPVQSGPILIDTLGSRFNTVLAVYTNNALTGLSQVAAGNDVTNQFGQFVRDKAFVKFNAIAGHTYRIAVAGASTNEFGLIRLRMQFNGDSDEGRPVVAITNMVSGTLSVTNPPSGLIVNQPLLTISGTAVDPAPNNSDVRLIQIVGNTGNPVVAAGTNEWTASVILQPGSNQLQVVAFDTAENQSIPLQFAITLRAFNPVNDIFANAIEFTNLNGAINVDNGNATFEGNEPLHAGKIGGKSIWYSFTPTNNGILTLSTTNSTIDTLLSLYTGERINELAVVVANDDAGAGLVHHSEISSGVIAGRKYKIAIDGLSGASGTIVLHHSFATADVYTLTAGSTSGGSVQPGSGVYSSNTLVSLVAVTNSGFNFITWTGGVVSLDNPLTFNVRSNIGVTAMFGRRQISDDYEGGVFNGAAGWSQAGDAGWSVEAVSAGITNTVFGGNYFARSGVITHNQNSELRIVSGMRSGRASFSYKLSTEATFDHLEFYLNGTNLLRESGEQDWRNFSFDVPEGSNTVSWVYRRDEANGGGLNSVFIDNIDLPLLSLVNTNVVVSLNTNAVRIVNQQFQIRIEGQTNQIYRVQASPDLANWVTLGTNYAPFGIIQYTDTVSTNHMFRFYRATTVD